MSTTTDAEIQLALDIRMAEDRDLVLSLSELANAVMTMSYALADHLTQPFDGDAIKALLARQETRV
jgi:hypothetical protein